MGIGINSNVIQPVDQKGVKLQTVPQFIEIEPAANVVAGSSSRVLYTVGVRDFVLTHIGFTADGVGFPVRGMPFKVAIEDIGASPERLKPAALLVPGKKVVAEAGCV